MTFEGLFDTVRDAIQGNLVVRDEERAALAEPAPNVIEWITGKEWCNVPTTYKFTRQYQIVRDFFQLRCPLCNPGGPIFMQDQIDRGHPGDCWKKGREWMESEALLVWSKEYDDDVCPKCGTTRTELREDDLVRAYNTLHCVVGMRSGKSVMAGLITTYVEHRLLTLSLCEHDGIQGYLGMPTAEQLEMTLLASTDAQSQDTIWAKYRNYREIAPWFQRYVPWVKSQEKLQHTPLGMKRWEYKESDKKFWNGHCKLLINSMNSNSDGLVGKTRVLSGADEIGRMKNTTSTQSASEIYRGLEASLRTVRTRAKDNVLLPWMGMMLSVTSPMEDQDKSMELLRIGQSQRVKGMIAFHYATWDFNPFEPRENFDDEFEKDPVAAQRNFGADPPKAAFPLIHDPERFERNGIGEQEPTATFVHIHHEDSTGQQYVGIKLEKCDLLHGLTKGGRQRVSPRVIAFDAGKNFDAFAGACAHAEWDEDDDGTRRLITVYDWIIRVLTPSRKVEVYFESVLDLVKDLKKRQPIMRVEFDRWQSLQMIQNIRQIGIFAEQAPVTDADFHAFAADALIGRVQLLAPDPEDVEREPPEKSPAGTVIYELEHLERDPKNDKVSNPRKGARRGWDCGYGDTPVVMADGTTKLLEDVQAGDCVLDQHGGTATVEAAWCSGTPPEIVELDVYGRDTLRFTANHRWPVWAWCRECQCGCGQDAKPGRLYVSGHNGGRGHGAGGVVVHGNVSERKLTKRIPDGYEPMQLLPSDEIRPGDFLMIPRGFNEASSPDVPAGRARLLGYYVAEGYLCANDRRVDFGFAAHERDTWVADVVGLLQEEGLGATAAHTPSRAASKEDDPNEGGMTVWSTNDQGRTDSSVLAGWLAEHGGRGSKTKRLSASIMRWPLWRKKELIRGLFRGDGCQTWHVKRHPRFTVQYSSASRALRDQVELILAQLGFPSRRSTGHHHRKGKTSTSYYLKVPQPWATELADMVWGEASRAREYERKDPMHHRCMVDDDYVYVPVKAVRVVPNNKPVYNLTVSGDHTYLVENVATHNSDDTAVVVAHVHKLVQATGYTKKADDRSKRSRRARAEAGGQDWGSRGSSFSPKSGGTPVHPTSGRRW